jgi:hypothetical protein
MNVRQWIACALAATALASCSEDETTTTTESATKTVGPEGGVLEVGGTTLTIPPSALAGATAITVSVGELTAPGEFVALSKVVKCEPTGTTFAVPATMRIPFQDDGLARTVFWSSQGDPTFKDIGGTAGNLAMTAEVRHFSAGFVGRRR